MRRLAERDTSNATWQRDLGISINGVGDVKAQRGDARGALAAYDEGLTIMRGLQAHDPTNLDLQREIAVRLKVTGAMKLSIGDAAAATADHEEGLTICVPWSRAIQTTPSGSATSFSASSRSAI